MERDRVMSVCEVYVTFFVVLYVLAVFVYLSSVLYVVGTMVYAYPLCSQSSDKTCCLRGPPVKQNIFKGH